MRREPAAEEVPSSGTLVIRGGRIILASDGAAALLRHPPEALHGMPLEEIFAPEDRARITDRYQRRMRGEPVPSDYEAEVLRADGTRATFDLHVDREGRDVVIRYRDISDEMVRRSRLQALAALGAAIQRERTEGAILERIRSKLSDLGISPLLMRALADGVRVEWSALPPEVEGEFLALFGRALGGFTGRWAPFSRKAWEEGVAFTDDWGAEAARFIPEAFAERARRLTTADLSRAIAVRIDERAGARFYLVLACGWLRGEDLAAVQLFGAQVAAALDAASAIADLSRRNDELAALNRLGELAGELEDLDDFLRQADETILRTSGAVGLAVYLVREGEGRLHRIHQTLLHGPSAPETCPLASAAGEAVRERTGRVVPESDGPAEVACLPLLARGRALGLLCARFEGAPGMARARLELLLSFAAHYAGAIQSHQLVSDLRRRLSDLTAVHALTGRIFGNRLGDVGGMLRDGCREVSAALACSSVAAFLLEENGAVLRGAALVGLPLDPEGLRVVVAGDRLASEAMRTGAPVWSPDVTRDERSALFGRRDVPAPAMLVVPLVARAATRGVLCLAAEAGRRFSDAEHALAMALAGELAMGLENAALHAAAQEQVRHLSLLGEMGRTLAGSLDLDQVLAVGADAACRLLATDRAFVVLRDLARGGLRVAAATGLLARELLDGYRPTLERSGVFRRVVQERRPVTIEDMEAFPEADPTFRRFGSRSLLAAPLLSRGEVAGVLYVDDCRRRRRFTEAEQERAVAVANRLAVAIENARLYEDLRRSYEQLAQTQRQLVQRERLAALGELAAVVAHEVRNPLGVIFNSLGSLRRMLRPEGDALLLLDIVGEEADRLNRIVGDLLDFARPVAPVLRPEPLERVMDAAVAAAVGDGPVEVLREIDPDLPPVALDARLFRQALVNVAANAVQAMPRGGRLVVRVRREPGGVLLELEDSGPGIPEEIRQRIFEPFFTTKVTGTGLGLAVVKRIVEGHGGEISVSGGPAGGTVVRILLPVAAGVVESGGALG